MPPESTSPIPAQSSPLISVIVVCKNPDLALRETLASIWAQHISPMPELIVVDGSTEDGSRVWLASQRARIATLIMEDDRGVYDAMNKGLAKATGEWVIFLGADDKFFHDGVLNRVQSALKQIPAGVAVGEIAYDDGRIYSLPKHPKPVERNFVHHQGAFYRRTLFTEHGLFDASLQIMGDYDYNLRLWQKKVVFAPLPLRITQCGTGGLSDSGQWLGYQEEITVRHKHYAGWKCWLWDLGSVIRFVRKQFTKKKRPAHA
jgi:glycosyltransferase involved in cell wall biosynthesis